MSENETNGESFAEMLEAYGPPEGGDPQVGDLVRGTVMDITDDLVFVDTGTKLDGVAERSELTGDDGELAVTVGDEVELYVVARDGGGIRLSKAISGVGGLHMLEQAQENALPVEGRVTGTVKGGFSVDILQRRAFCPVSQMDTAYVEDPEQYVGQAFQFLVIKLEQRGRNVVLSRRKLLEREREEEARRLESELHEGDEVTGRVTRLASFGAFVEIGPGVEGLVHISELGWSRVEEPSVAVAVGDEVRAKVLSMERDTKGRLKVSLSMRQAMPDPWLGVGGKYSDGQKVTGKVVRLADFGAFVELEPGVEGLVHVSEMSFTKRVLNPADEVAVGDEVSVTVREVDLERRRISLSLRDAAGDPWLEAPDKYTPGTTVRGRVEKVERFGVFVALEPGVVGLLPKSNFAKAAKPADLDRLSPGDEVAVLVEAVRLAERRISLAPADAREAGDWKRYAGGAGRPDAAGAPTGGQGMGLLGQKLQQAMQDKKKGK